MFFRSDKEVIELAGKFYRRELPMSKWDAATQLTITLYYALRFPYRMAFEVIRERAKVFDIGFFRTEGQSAKLEDAIHHWLNRSKTFARDHENIEDLSSLTNIFIATNWKSEAPYQQAVDKAVLDADTARFVCRNHVDLEVSTAKLALDQA